MIYAFEDRRAGRRRWQIALACGLLLHAGALYAALAPVEVAEEQDDAHGPVAIELAPLPVAPQADNLDVPVGPRMDETPAAVPTPQVTEVAKAEEAPELPTTPYEPDDPELRMARANPETQLEEAKEQEATTERIEQPPVAPAVPVPETTAPQPSVAQPADTAAAPEAGMSETDRQVVVRWQRKLVAHLNAFKRYPAEARRRHEQGDVEVTFTMDRDGRLVARGVVGRSGSATLDAAALELLERAAPLPKPPPQIVGGEVVLRLPLQYRMKD